MTDDMTDRIRQVMEYLGLGRLEFSKALGMPSQTRFRRILNDGKIPQPSDLNRILITFPQIRRNWLYDGRGEMLKPGASPVNSPAIGNIGHITGGVNSFHNDEGKDKVIKTQERQVIQMFETFMVETRDFHKYMKQQDRHIHEILKHTYLRNERNMERLDRMFEQQSAVIGQQNKLIELALEQSKKTQERADKVIDLIIDKF